MLSRRAPEVPWETRLRPQSSVRPSCGFLWFCRRTKTIHSAQSGPASVANGGIQRVAKIARREGSKAKYDVMGSGRDLYGAEQDVGAQDRRRLAVDLDDPAGIIDVMQQQQAVSGGCHKGLHAAGP